jgi:hypothetical protein
LLVVTQDRLLDHFPIEMIKSVELDKTTSDVLIGYVFESDLVADVFPLVIDQPMLADDPDVLWILEEVVETFDDIGHIGHIV